MKTRNRYGPHCPPLVQRVDEQTRELKTGTEMSEAGQTLMARRTIMMASCSDRSVSSMNCSAPPLRMMVHVLAFGQPLKKLYLREATPQTRTLSPTTRLYRGLPFCFWSTPVDLVFAPSKLIIMQLNMGRNAVKQYFLHSGLDSDSKVNHTREWNKNPNRHWYFRTKVAYPPQ